MTNEERKAAARVDMRLTIRETATVLAALRYWQRDLRKNGVCAVVGLEHFKDVAPLSSTAIDDLCERIAALERGKVCQTCGGSGAVDSGGVQPWGAAIYISCPDCALERGKTAGHEPVKES